MSERRPKSRRTSDPVMKVFLDHKTPMAFGDDAKGSGRKEDYDDYESTCERIRQDNEQLLDEFAASLRSQRLALRTIKAHRDNVEFFINEFLLRENARRPTDGMSEVDAYLGDWFIRKATWSIPRTIKSNATSLYKFYAYLALSGKVAPTDLVELKETIAVRLPEWQAMCERYNDLDVDDWRGTD